MGGREGLIGRDILLAAVIGFLITWGGVNAVGQEQVLMPSTVRTVSDLTPA